MELTKQYYYLPVLKTTDAELRGFEELKSSVKSEILPIFELTRSRKTTKNVNSTVDRRMDNLKGLLEDRSPFILDVTAHEDLSNIEIEQFSDETDGFANWCDFVERSQKDGLPGLIPVIHVFPAEENVDHEIVSQVNRLDKHFSNLAFRFVLEDEYVGNADQAVSDLQGFLDLILNNLSSDKLVLILDAQFVNVSNLDSKVDAFNTLLNTLTNLADIKIISLCSSSFPKSVVGHKGHPDGCLDHKGTILNQEKVFFNKVSESSSVQLVYSDYASIHPYRIQVPGGGWVPRIDFPLTDRIIYKRYRRKVGGYVTAAQDLVTDDCYIQNVINCWGGDQIVLASIDEPNGKSPVFWISVRINIYITRLMSGGNLPRCLIKKA